MVKDNPVLIRICQKCDDFRAAYPLSREANLILKENGQEVGREVITAKAIRDHRWDIIARSLETIVVKLPQPLTGDLDFHLEPCVS